MKQVRCYQMLNGLGVQKEKKEKIKKMNKNQFIAS